MVAVAAAVAAAAAAAAAAAVVPVQAEEGLQEGHDVEAFPPGGTGDEMP